MKAPQASNAYNAPRLGVVQSGQTCGGSQNRRRQQADTQQVGPEESRQDVELRLKRALESLSEAEMRMAELAREEAQARFDCEDAQVRYIAVTTKVLTPSKSYVLLIIMQSTPPSLTSVIFTCFFTCFNTSVHGVVGS